MNHLPLRVLALMTASSLSLASACDRPDEPPDEDATRAEAADDGGADNHPHHDDHHHGAEPAGEAPTSLAELPEGTNAVQHEMRLLDDAMRITLTLLANGELAGIPAQIQRVHPARQITEEAIAAGAYTPPKRADDLAEFQALDDAFHDDLKVLLQAAGRDDLEAATEAYADLVRGCTSCHQAFRF